MDIEKIKIDKLKSPDYNPRDITPEAMESLKKSITEFGYIDPIIVNKHNMHVVGGNQRYEAMKQLGYKEVEVSFVNIEDINQEKALNLRLNNNSGTWNDIKLNNILEELKIKDVDISLTGFEDITIPSYDYIDFNIDSNNDYEEITEYSSNEDTYSNLDDEEYTFEDIDELYTQEDNSQNNEEEFSLNYKIGFNNPIDEDIFYKFVEYIKKEYNRKSITDNILNYFEDNVEKYTSNIPFKSDFEIIFKSKDEKQKFLNYTKILKERYTSSRFPIVDFIKEFENEL